MNVGVEVPEAVYTTIRYQFEQEEYLSSVQVALRTGYHRHLVEMALSDLMGTGELLLLQEKTIGGNPIYRRAQEKGTNKQ